MPKALRRALRLALIVIFLLACLVLGLSVGGLIHLPPLAVAVCALALPVLIAGTLSGIVAPLVPGALTMWSGRYGVGDQVIFGPVSNPLAEGTVLAFDLYITSLVDEKGQVVTVTNQVVHSLTVTQLPPLPRA